jgi:predicted ATPase
MKGAAMNPLNVKAIRLAGFLSFAPDSPPVELRNLNVLIGPNGSGKSNLIEAFELLHATPTAFANAIRDGGGADEWLWKGKSGKGDATIEVTLAPSPMNARDLRYLLAFRAVNHRLEVVDEVLEETSKRVTNAKDVFFYYRFQGGHPAINTRKQPYKVEQPRASDYVARRIERQMLRPDESVLSQRKEPDLYPEVAWLGGEFERIQTFREWSFGRYADLRKPQSASLPGDVLLPSCANLGMVLNELEHRGYAPEFNRCLKRFFPRFERMSTRVIGGTVQFYLHESGFASPIPATRLSDGTIRFLALLATLLNPEPPPLVCIEEPELGLHPDALSLIADLLVAASDRMQLVVTTHSDVLVSALTEHAEAVLVCERIAGASQLRRVEAARIQDWLDRYRLGDLWRIGELGGNP